MGYLDAIARVTQLQQLIQQADAPAVPGASQATFGAALQAASSAMPPGLVGGDSGQRAVSVAEGEVGTTEQPPGSNDGARIAEYRGAVAGAYPGAPWCAYFVSWCARQAGAPIGDGGAGLGSVAGIADWARGTGRLTDVPAAGELILFGDRHVGIVESVNPDGTVTTVEGNSGDGVHRRVHRPWEATGYVRL